MAYYSDIKFDYFVKNFQVCPVNIIFILLPTCFGSKSLSPDNMKEEKN